MSANEPLNIIITGVGGQGNVVASRLLATAAVAAGFQAAVGETFGAAQRGGAVVSHVRISAQTIFGPLIPRGRAEIILGLEPLETLRVLLDYGRPETMVIMNDRPVRPISVLSGQERYPDPAKIEQAARRLAPDTRLVPAVDLALGLGQAGAANVVMLGALLAAGRLPLERSHFETALAEVFPPELVELNTQALAAGLAVAGG
ncbi:MAG: indolepyruvate oxidoreductase subunit beta [Deltaproteobacteria bacterium]|nr:indolepyruvate oxidoreductase subunit beta [Deltaproteobacteria bacterium]